MLIENKPENQKKTGNTDAAPGDVQVSMTPVASGD
jgi:hypothetical protein